MKISKQKLIEMIIKETKALINEEGYGNREDIIKNISDMFQDIYGAMPIERDIDLAKMSDEDLTKLERDMEEQHKDFHYEELTQDALENTLEEAQISITAGDTWRKEGHEADANYEVKVMGVNSKNNTVKIKYVGSLLGKPPRTEEVIPVKDFLAKYNKRSIEDGAALNTFTLTGKEPHPRDIIAQYYNLSEVIKEELSQLLKEMYIDPENLSAEDELGFADGAQPRSAKERLLAMLLAAEDIERLRAEFADDIEMQKELDKVEANPFYNPQGAYKSPRMSEGFIHHVVNDKPLTENVYRVGSDSYFELIREVREQYKKGIYKPLNEEEQEMLDSDLGEWAEFEGESVPLDFPMYEETLDEKRKRKKKKKKDPPIGKPTKNTGGGKKYKVFVRSPSGRIRKITYGDSKGGLKGNWNSAEARASFASRHKCKEKKDRTKAGYWACRAHKDFGTNVPGRFW